MSVGGHFHGAFEQWFVNNPRRIDVDAGMQTRPAGEFVPADAVGDAGHLDAVYICNHGAMVAEDDHDPDGLLMARVREVVGPDVLIVSTLDLHANISDRMVDACDLIVGYRTNPHVDQIERGEEAAFSLRRCLASGQRPKIAHVKLPLVAASVTDL